MLNMKGQIATRSVECGNLGLQLDNSSCSYYVTEVWWDNEGCLLSLLRTQLDSHDTDAFLIGKSCTIGCIVGFGNC
jgi:hypothetical protein